MEYLGNPIVNDVLYGAKKVLELNENQICLHSKKIRFEIKDENVLKHPKKLAYNKNNM